MILIWRGWGLLVPLMMLLFLWFSNLIANGIAGYNYSESNSWIYSIGLFAVAIPIWFLGKHLNKNSPKFLINVKTNKRQYFPKKHSFFEIPFESCSLLSILLGLMFLNILSGLPG